MKGIKVKIIESIENIKLLDIGIPVSGKIIELIEKESYLKLHNGVTKFKTEEFLYSYLAVEILEEDIERLEETINKHLKNAR